MSKMSQLHAELTSQAAELGFESIEEAEANGYKVDYNGSGWVLKQDVNKAMEEARKEWLEERDLIIKRLNVISTLSKYDRDTIEMAIAFIKKGEV